jgi:hypothetical protein
MGNYTELVEKLNSVLRTFSFELVRKHGLRIEPFHYHICVAETTTYSHYVEAGSPVVIKFGLAYVVEALASRNKSDKIELIQHILRSLEQVPRMLHTVSLVPRRDVLAYKQEVRRWFTYKGDKRKLSHEFPSKDVVVSYIEIVKVLHLPTDTLVVVDQRAGANRALVDVAMAALREELYGSDQSRGQRTTGSGKKDSRTASGIRIFVSNAEASEVGSGEEEASGNSGSSL